jgi:hypothetical protein
MLRRYTVALLRAIEWHGVAMVEFKHEPATGRYTLMEINGRFQASTALSLDAGLNLPHLVAALFAGAPLPEQRPPRIGVRERWLRGDLLALGGAWRGTGTGALPGRATAGRLAVTWIFLKDFLAGMSYDEFAWDDWRPGLAEIRELIAVAARWAAGRLWGLICRVVALAPSRRVASAPTQRSIRA